VGFLRRGDKWRGEERRGQRASTERARNKLGVGYRGDTRAAMGTRVTTGHFYFRVPASMWHDADPEFDEDGGEEDGPLLVSAAVSSGPVGGLGGRRLTAEAAAVVAVEDVEEDAAGGGRSLQLPEPEEVAAAQDPTARWTPRERVLVLVFASVAAFLQVRQTVSLFSA